MISVWNQGLSYSKRHDSIKKAYRILHRNRDDIISRISYPPIQMRLLSPFHRSLQRNRTISIESMISDSNDRTYHQAIGVSIQKRHIGSRISDP
ncbi:hypothetical protein AVEN_215086-1 [Araneus ventricosus]|uniref:Uncharacterized protein n=1 Tax=Araneus ventricosus TaxID=182803 RepID=A0A4Y2X0T8_ARAVE|nr:hypothetical protein AVEN_215086-1 [Araneus ventricosus]